MPNSGALLLAIALSASGAEEAPATRPKAGDIYEITMVRDSSEHGSDGSSGSSHDEDTISERVIAVRSDGLELEYDLPKNATKEERQASWQFPVRVLKPHHGQIQLLNAEELAVRVDRWLKKAKWSRAVCGHWIFTWNAFRIECDPQSVAKTIEAFDVQERGLLDGASYRSAGTLGEAILSRQTSAAGGASFTAELPIDAKAILQAEAESDFAVGEVMQKPVTLEQAMLARAKETVTGTVAVQFDADASGQVRRKTTVTKLEIKRADGSSERRTVKQTIDRKLISGRRT